MRLVAAAAVLLVLSLVASPARAQPAPPTIYAVPLGDSPQEGQATAPITVVEFSDFACEHCVRSQATVEAIDRLYPGQVRWVHRALPLDDDNVLAIEAGLAAAAQGRYPPMHDRLFAAHGKVDRQTVERFAAALRLDMRRFRADLDTGAWRATIAVDTETARALGVSGTPAFFVNGRFISGNRPLQVFATVIDEELQRVRALRAGGATPAGMYAAAIAGGVQRVPAQDADALDFQELDPGTIYQMGLGLPGHQQGSATAPVTLVEWSDFQCPYCVKHAPVITAIAEHFGPKVRRVFRHFPLRFHAAAPLAAEAAVEAGAQGRFWPFRDWLFAHPGQLDRASLEQAAQAVGLDLPRFRAALDSRRHRDAVATETAAAAALGVNGTPTVFVNGLPVVGAATYEEMLAIVDDQLRQVTKAAAAGVPVGDLYALLMASAHGRDRSDPAGVPQPPSVGTIELGENDREHAVVAACRRSDRPAATSLATRLKGDALLRARRACRVLGVDLP